MSEMVDDLLAEIGMLREKLSDALAGGLPHKSDCAVYNAPAEEPGPCDCGVGASFDDGAYDLARKLREHNGWERIVSDADAVNLIKAFIASSRQSPAGKTEYLSSRVFDGTRPVDEGDAARLKSRYAERSSQPVINEALK